MEKPNMQLQIDLLDMYRAFLKHDHGTSSMDRVDIEKLYDTLDHFKKFVDEFLRDFIAFSIKHRGKTEEQLLDELISTILDKINLEEKGD